MSDEKRRAFMTRWRHFGSTTAIFGFTFGGSSGLNNGFAKTHRKIRKVHFQGGFFEYDTPYDTPFGGAALSLMNEIAFITATRFLSRHVVTVSSDHDDFTHPIASGTIIELVGELKKS